MAVPEIINPTSEATLAADVEVIQVSGADNDTTLNGLYAITKPKGGGASGSEVWTHTTTGINTIAFDGSQYGIEISGVDQFLFDSNDPLLAPISGNIDLGAAVYYELSGGTGPAIPLAVKRTAVPSTLTP